MTNTQWRRSSVNIGGATYLENESAKTKFGLSGGGDIRWQHDFAENKMTKPHAESRISKFYA